MWGSAIWRTIRKTREHPQKQTKPFGMEVDGQHVMVGCGRSLDGNFRVADHAQSDRFWGCECYGDLSPSGFQAMISLHSGGETSARPTPFQVQALLAVAAFAVVIEINRESVAGMVGLGKMSA